MQTADSRQREMALDITRSVCVQAPAGSGKTGLLTQRILKLLALSEQPENILAITFTRKAAAEMKERLMELLHKARHTTTAIENMDSYDRFNQELAMQVLSRDQEQQWHLLQNPSRLQIMTIDSFNSYLATRLSLLSGFGAQPAIREPSDTLYNAAVVELFRSLESNNPVTGSLSQMLLHFGNNLNQVQSLLATMLAKRDQWLRHIVGFRSQADTRIIRQYIETNIRHLIEERLHSLAQHLDPWMGEIMQFLAYSKENLLEEGNNNHPLTSLTIPTGTPHPSCHQLDLWKAISAMLMTNQGSLRKTTDKRNGFPVSNSIIDKKTASAMKSSFTELLGKLSTQPGLTEELAEIPHLPESDFENEQWQILTAITDVLFHLSGILDLEFQKSGQCDYTQVSLAALKSLGDEDNPTSTALLMDYRIQHILVDEFQDTSHLQIELLEKLTRGWVPGDGHSLFIVGDPMQSCYGFRNAVVGLFLTTRDQGLGNLQLDDIRLKTNFRSDAAVIRWINDIFSSSFPAEDEPSRGAVSYTPAEAINDDSEHNGIHCHLIVPGNDTDFDRLFLAEREAHHVITRISSIRAENPDDSIALLVKNRTHLKQLLPALKQAGIQWNASDLDPLDNWQDIQDLLTLCKALLNLSDKTAWLALLRTPFVGLEMADIFAINQEAKAQNLTICEWLLRTDNKISLSDTAQTIVSRVVPVLRHARDNRLRLSLRDWLEEAWVLLGGPVCLHQSLEPVHLETFFTLLEEESELGDITDMAVFEKRLASTRTNSHGGPDVKLEIMTIHKAKGLEFDHVILPCLNEGGRSDQGQLLQWQETLDQHGETGLLLSVPARKGADANSLHAFISRESKTRSQLEQARLLYIGITRAKKSAWLSATVKKDRNGQPACTGNTLLSHIWKALQPLEKHTTLDVADVSGQKTASVSDSSNSIYTRRLPPAWQPSSTLPVTDTVSFEDATTSLLPNKAERCRGDIVHECLQLIASGCKLADQASREMIWRQRLTGCTDDPEPYLQEILRQIHLIQESDTVAWILSPDHDQAVSEMSLSDYRQQIRREFIIDRTFIDNNIRWIIDFKTATPPSNQSVQAFLAFETNRYRPQLDRYAELISRITEGSAHQIKTALYFTALDILVEISEVQHGNQSTEPL